MRSREEHVFLRALTLQHLTPRLAGRVAGRMVCRFPSLLTQQSCSCLFLSFFYTRGKSALPSVNRSPSRFPFTLPRNGVRTRFRNHPLQRIWSLPRGNLSFACTRCSHQLSSISSLCFIAHRLYLAASIVSTVNSALRFWFKKDAIKRAVVGCFIVVPSSQLILMLDTSSVIVPVDGIQRLMFPSICLDTIKAKSF